MKELVHKWFELWESGDFHNLPLHDDFMHTSPYGVIQGKKAYLELVEANKDNFLGHRFKLHDEFYAEEKACVRYTGSKGGSELHVSEWYYMKDGRIHEIISHYSLGDEIPDKNKLADSSGYD